MYPILVFDSDMNYLAQIDDYEYLQWTRRWRKPHSWELHINRYKKHVELLMPDHFIAVKRGGKWRTGRIGHKEIGLTQEGKISENWTVKGYSLDGVFYDRIALHNVSSGNGYDEQNAAAEDVMRHYVNINCINPVDATRTIPFLHLGNGLARGKKVQVRARFQTIAQLLEDLSLGSGLGYETTIDLANQRFVFDVLEGHDLTPNQTEHSPVIFSPEFDNVKLLGFRLNRMDAKNTAIVAGQGEAQERLIINISDPALTGFARREVFIDARDLQTAEQLLQRGTERLNESKEELVMEIEHLPNGPFKYMVDFDIGDIIHANYPGIGSTESRIIEVVEEVTPDQGDSFKLIIGKEWPDLISVLKADRKNLEVEVRR
ncbi:siphovirus ReqiPepy6 Gp37-like family protein [Paenibacillus sp. RC84]|uniref:siphovirus ReqiPepy6 Gp37-like family protein n=1 Tax=Paenibacillus sp. RC84 TaxID=3156252 RepID=UPI00351757C3